MALAMPWSTPPPTMTGIMYETPVKMASLMTAPWDFLALLAPLRASSAIYPIASKSSTTTEGASLMTSSVGQEM